MAGGSDSSSAGPHARREASGLSGGTSARSRRRNRRPKLFLVGFFLAIIVLAAAIVTPLVYDSQNRASIECTVTSAQQVGSRNVAPSVNVDTDECGTLNIKLGSVTVEEAAGFADSIVLGGRYSFSIGVIAKFMIPVSKIIPPRPAVMDPQLVE